jgi:integrase
VQNELAIVKQFYAWGQARHGWPTNPTTLAAKPRVRNRQPRPVEDETWLTFWLSDLPPVARVITGLGYFCGLRRNELVTLTGGQVWGGSLVNFIRKGGGEDRFDYLDIVAHFQHFLPHLRADLLVEPLERLARERGPARLVPWQSHRPQALNKRLPGWLESAGLPGNAFGPHQLRHSFATNLLSSFVPLDVASDLCNHSSPTITMRYVRTSGGRLASLRGITHTQEARKDGTSYAS